MEIVNINPYALGIKGGVEVHLSYQTERLRELGHHVTNVVGAGSPEKFEEYEQCKDPFFAVGTERGDFDDDHKDLLIGADEVHLHNLHTLGRTKYGILNEFLKRNVQGSKVYFHTHNFNGTDAEKEAIGSFTGAEIIVYSGFMQRTVLEECGRQSLVKQYFFPSKPPTVRDMTTDAPTIIQPTRFNSMKGSHISLASAATILDRGNNIRFVHAGFNWSKSQVLFDEIFSNMSPKEMQSVRRWIKQGRIVLKGYGYEELLDEIDDAELVVLPTSTRGPLGEPFGIAALQSIALNRLIIASDSGYYSTLFGAEGYTHSLRTRAGSRSEFDCALYAALERESFGIDDKAKDWADAYTALYQMLRETSLDIYR